MNYQEWLDQKYKEWEHTQTGRQTYYNFAHYLDVNHTLLAQWMNGVSQPEGDDLEKIADKLGDEIYGLVGATPPSDQFQAIGAAFMHLPNALRNRFAHAILEIDQQITQRKLDPESDEAKRLAVKTFDKWGFRITG